MRQRLPCAGEETQKENDIWSVFAARLPFIPPFLRQGGLAQASGQGKKPCPPEKQAPEGRRYG